MARVVRLNAPPSMRLHEMDVAEIERHVKGLADHALELAGENKVIGVNAVALGQLNEDVGVWGEWTRSCFQERDSIDDYVDPSPEEFGIAEGVLPPGIPLGSQMQVTQLRGEQRSGG